MLRYPFSSSFKLVSSFSLLLSLLLLDAQKKTKSNHQDVENVEALPGTCFFKMPSGSPARSTSVEFVESVPGTDGYFWAIGIYIVWYRWLLSLISRHY
jgi:hypothetical protein